MNVKAKLCATTAHEGKSDCRLSLKRSREESSMLLNERCVLQQSHLRTTYTMTKGGPSQVAGASRSGGL